ncbi:MAG TPA: CpaD family pilus assembly protein [Rhizomicrobium sp.]|nr:CpaD family pilus assembly protein [Rhizomicrobium sp.]
MEINSFFRGLSLAAVLLAGSCAAPGNNAGMLEDGAVNHPISVEPAYQSLKLSYAPADTGISSADQARFANFVSDYEAHGNGSIAVSAPSGVNSQVMISFFAQRINDLGVSKDRILVATHDAPANDQRVEINYVSYQAHTTSCGDWSEDLAVTYDNQTAKNFGCAVQQNIAAQIADPRDLMGPRRMDASDATRRATVLDHYEKGEVTQATKRVSDAPSEQSAPGSSVGAN